MLLSLPVICEAYRCKLATAQLWLPHLSAAAQLCDVDEDPNRLACFLAQIGHESGRLRYTREIWGPTSQQERYEYGTPLAQTLGNFQIGDGFRYRGRGLIQTTGRNNYKMTGLRLAQALKEDSSKGDMVLEVPDFEQNPEALERPLWAALSAGLYWRVKGLNRFADAHDFVLLTKRINGGINGLADRQVIFAAAYTAIVHWSNQS